MRRSPSGCLSVKSWKSYCITTFEAGIYNGLSICEQEGILKIAEGLQMEMCEAGVRYEWESFCFSFCLTMRVWMHRGCAGRPIKYRLQTRFVNIWGHQF